MILFFFLFTPQITSAETTLSPGDVIKGSGSAVYYYGIDDKRYLFPNEGIFLSWYGDFSEVKKISDTDLANIPHSGRNVIYRPGNFLIKISSDPKVYAVTPGGILRWVSNENLAKQHWGDDWKTLVRDVSDSLFSNYTIGEPIKKFSYPAGSVISDETNTYYVNVKGERQKISSDGVKKNRFDRFPKLVHPERNLRWHPMGVDIPDSEVSLGDILKNEGVSVLASGLGSLLEVKLSSSTPTSHYILKEGSSSERVEALTHLASFDFTAGSDGDILIEKLTFSFETELINVEFSDLYLFADDTEVAQTSVTNASATFSQKELFRIPRGATKTLKLRGDLLPRSLHDGVVKIKIAKKEDIAVNSGVILQGNFPLIGEKMFVKETKDLGEIQVASVSVPRELYVGEKDAELWRVSVSALNRNTEIHSLRFRLISSLSQTDLKNFKIFEDRKQIGKTVTSLSSDGTVTFDVRSKPYVVPAGQSRTLELHAEIAGGVQREFSFAFEKSSDIIAFDQYFKIYVKPNGGGNFSGVRHNEYTLISLRPMELTLERHPSNNYVSFSEANVELAKFRLKPFAEDVRIKAFDIEAEMEDGKILNNVRFLFNEVQMEEVVDLPAHSPLHVNFSKPIDLPKDKNSYLLVYADILSPLEKGDTILIKISNMLGKSTTSVKDMPIGGLTSYTLTVTSPMATVARSSEEAFSGKVNSANVLVGRFTVTVGPLYDVELTHLVLKDAGIGWKDEFESVFLVKGKADPSNSRNRIASEMTSLGQGGAVYSFELNPHLSLKRNSVFTFDVYAKKVLSTATTESEHISVILDSLSLNEYVSRSDVRNITFTEDISGQKVLFEK